MKREVREDLVWDAKNQWSVQNRLNPNENLLSTEAVVSGWKLFSSAGCPAVSSSGPMHRTHLVGKIKTTAPMLRVICQPRFLFHPHGERMTWPGYDLKWVVSEWMKLREMHSGGKRKAAGQPHDPLGSCHETRSWPTKVFLHVVLFFPVFFYDRGIFWYKSDFALMQWFF